MYLLTPRDIEGKGDLTVRFLKAKLLEYENLRADIEEVRREVGGLGAERHAGGVMP